MHVGGWNAWLGFIDDTPVLWLHRRYNVTISWISSLFLQLCVTSCFCSSYIYEDKILYKIHKYTNALTCLAICLWDFGSKRSLDEIHKGEVHDTGVDPIFVILCGGAVLRRVLLRGGALTLKKNNAHDRYNNGNQIWSLKPGNCTRSSQEFCFRIFR